MANVASSSTFHIVLFSESLHPPIRKNTNMARVSVTEAPRHAPIATLLKIFEIILAIIILCLVCIKPSGETSFYPDYPSYRNYPFLTGEEFTVATAVFAIVFTLHFLLSYLSGCHHHTEHVECKCMMMAIAIYLLTAAMWIISAGVETWITTRIFNDNHYGVSANMRASVAAFCFLEAILYVLSFILAKMGAY